MSDPASILAAERLGVEQQLAGVEQGLASLGAERSASTSDDEHDPEGSTLSSDWSQLTGLGRSLRERLRLIDNALTRVGEGTYGFCLNCGRPIGARLGVRPEAELCIECAGRG